MRWVLGLAVLVCVGLLFWLLDHDPVARRKHGEVSTGTNDRVARVTPDAAPEREPEKATTESKPKKKGRTVRVQVVDKSGKGVARLPLALHKNERKIAEAQTDASGLVAFESVRGSFFLLQSGKMLLGLVRSRGGSIDRIEVEWRGVRVQVTVNGKPGIPNGLSIEGVAIQSANAATGEIDGYTFMGASRSAFAATAPGYEPTALTLTGTPFQGKLRFKRGVKVTFRSHGYPQVRLRAQDGNSFGGHGRRLSQVYHLVPGTYEVLSTHLRTHLGTVVVPDIYTEMEVHLLKDVGMVTARKDDPENKRTQPLPPFTHVKISAPDAWTNTKLVAEVDGKTRRFPATVGAVVLPSGPVVMSVEHPTLLPAPDSVKRVVQGPVDLLEFRLRWGPSIQFQFVQGGAAQGRVLLFEPGNHDEPLLDRPYGLRGRTSFYAGAIRVDGATPTPPRKPTRVTAAVTFDQDSGRYDVWIVPLRSGSAADSKCQHRRRRRGSR